MKTIEVTDIDLNHRGIHLNCRAAGDPAAPVVLLVHGFPEGAFVWDAMLLGLAEAGFRAVAPDLRGFGLSSVPAEVERYRISEIAADLIALTAIVSPDRPLAALVAHDWGGAAGWALGNRAPHLMERLVIINSPHPGLFLRGLKTDPAQQTASAYMNVLAAPDAEERFSADEYALLWRFFTGMGATSGGADGKGWLTEDVRSRYREHWDLGLTGGLNYYRATPVRPGMDLDAITLPPEMLTVSIPTHVIWGTLDTALLPGLIDGLDEYVSNLDLHSFDDASHWIVHEYPERVLSLLTSFLA